MSGLTLSPSERNPVTIVQAIRQLMDGRNNATGTVTLAVAPATTTVVPAPNCAPGCHVSIFQQTANAAAALATTYIRPVDVVQQQFTITHAASAQADRTFSWVCLG